MFGNNYCSGCLKDISYFDDKICKDCKLIMRKKQDDEYKEKVIKIVKEKQKEAEILENKLTLKLQNNPTLLPRILTYLLSTEHAVMYRYNEQSVVDTIIDKDALFNDILN